MLTFRHRDDRLRLEKHNEVGDSGGHHRCQRAPGHGEEVLGGEGVHALHPADGVLQSQHLSAQHETMTIDPPMYSLAQNRADFLDFKGARSLEEICPSSSKKSGFISLDYWKISFPEDLHLYVYTWKSALFLRQRLYSLYNELVISG